MKFIYWLKLFIMDRYRRKSREKYASDRYNHDKYPDRRKYYDKNKRSRYNDERQYKNYTEDDYCKNK